MKTALLILGAVTFTGATGTTLQNTKPMQQTKSLTELQPAKNIAPKTYNPQKTISGNYLQGAYALDSQILVVK